MDTMTMAKETVEKGIKQNGLSAMLIVAPKRTRYYLTHEKSYGRKENYHA